MGVHVFTCVFLEQNDERLVLNVVIGAEASWDQAHLGESQSGSGTGPSTRTQSRELNVSATHSHTHVHTKALDSLSPVVISNLHVASDGRRRSPAGVPPPERHNLLSQGKRRQTWAVPRTSAVLPLTRLVLPRHVTPSPT